MNRFHGVVSGLWNGFCELVWPSRCAGCDAFIGHGVGFCDACQVSVLTLEGACPRCAMPGGQGARGCGHCNLRWQLEAVWCGAQYGGALATAIVRYKHSRRLDLVRPLSQLVVGGLATYAAPAVLVVPVPLHPRRLRRRGFNQALDLARFALAQLPRAQRPRLLPAALARVRDSSSPSNGRIDERRKRAEGAFVVRSGRAVQGRDVIVVDDVLTTGATMNACATALLAAGARQVRGVAIARAV